MTKDPFRKLSKAFVLIVVIQTHVSKWEAIIVSRSRTPRGMRTVPLTIICHDIAPSDPILLRRVGSSRGLSIQETRRSVDISVSFNSPEFNGTSANGM